MSKVQAFYELLVHDKDGKLVSTTGKKSCKSFVLQFLQLLEVGFYTTDVTIKDDTGADKTVSTASSDRTKCAWGAGVEHGIRVGTGTTAVAYDDYALETPIAHGTGSGELSYGNTSKTTTAHSGGNIDLIITRTFNNGSGAGINVTEVGVDGKAGGFYHLMVHEIFSAVAVANTQTLTVNITFRTTV